MVTCACGKTIEKIPDWLNGAKVDFVCNDCPNRHLKNIAFLNLDDGLKTKPALDEGDVDLADEIEDEE